MVDCLLLLGKTGCKEVYDATMKTTLHLLGHMQIAVVAYSLYEKC